MTTIHARLIGDKAVLSRDELEHLLQLARRTERVDLCSDDELPTSFVMQPAAGGGFDFWNDDGENVYTAQGGEPM